MTEKKMRAGHNVVKQGRGVVKQELSVGVSIGDSTLTAKIAAGNGHVYCRRLFGWHLSPAI